MHTDPHFIVKDQSVLHRFYRYAGIDPKIDSGVILMEKLCQAFSQIPYENLTKIIKSDTVVSAGSAKRLPEEVIQSHLDFGTGGTCFSLTAAFIAVFNALDIEAHPILADRYYGSDTHCALVFLKGTDLYLLDPGYLINTPLLLPISSRVSVVTMLNTIELVPHDAGKKVDLFTIVGNDRRNRLTYKVDLVDGSRYGQAWEHSFTWEMMTYPVLTRYHKGRHHYLQGNRLRVRDGERSTKKVLTSDERCLFMTDVLGIHRDIVNSAMEVIPDGEGPTADSS